MRPARLTDLAALGELSRLSHADERQPDERQPDERQADSPTAPMRTLGLPVGGSHISMFSLFRLPLGGFRASDLLYVYESRGRIAGLARVERESARDEWTIVELDAIDYGEAGDIRYRLVQHILRDASKRGAIRFHVACADTGGNVDLFMQAGFARYGEERILFRSTDAANQQRPASSAPPDPARLGIRPAVALDAHELDRLYRAATPAPVARLEDYRLQDWERQGSHWRVPRSSLTPILRFADVEAFVQEAPSNGTGLNGFCQIGVAKEDQPHYMRVIARAEHDPSDLIAYGLHAIAERRQGAEHGVITAVRTYESPIDRRLEEHGFAGLSNVSLLMKEVAIRVFEPALAPVATH